MSTCAASYKTVLFCVLSVSCVLMTAVCARAQTVESVGTRAQGMGGAFLAVADDATATWWNPAGLATGALFNALVEYDHPRTPAGTSIKGLAFAIPSFGFSYYRLPINQMRPAGSTGTAAESRQDQGVLSVYGATAGQSVGTHLVVGSTLKLVRAGQSHPDLDIGAMARFGIARVAAVVKNVRKPTFDTDEGPLELKRQARVGAALLGQTSGLVNQLALAFDADLTTVQTKVGDERHIAGGLEVLAWKKIVAARIGASANTVGARRAALSGGLSLMFASGTYVKSYLDTHLTGGSDEARRGWGAALRVTF